MLLARRLIIMVFGLGIGLIGANLLGFIPSASADGLFTIIQTFPQTGATAVPVNITNGSYIPSGFGYAAQAFNFQVTLSVNPVGCTPDKSTFNRTTVFLTSPTDSQSYDLTVASSGLNTTAPWLSVGNPNHGFELLPFTTYTLTVVGGTNGIAITCGTTRYRLDTTRTIIFTTGQDTVPPQIIASQAQTTSTTASINWETFQPSSGMIVFGQTQNYDRQQTDTIFDTFHHLKLTGLQPGTTYFYQLHSRDSAGNVGTVEGSLTTLGIGPISIDHITSSSASIHWDSTTTTDSIVIFGLDDEYGQQQGNAGQLTHHTVVLAGLKASQTYHFAIRATNGAGVSTFSDNVFATLNSDFSLDQEQTVSSQANVLLYPQNSPSGSAVLGASDVKSNQSEDSLTKTSGAKTSTGLTLVSLGIWFLPLLLLLLIGFFWWRSKHHEQSAESTQDIAR